MQIRFHFYLVIVLCLLITGCSKKHQPQKEITVTDIPESAKPETKKPVKKVVHTPVPKTITLDDRGAKKAVDGRLYYDLEGHRYWRNYKDGKYHLYKEGMFDDPAFKPQ